MAAREWWDKMAREVGAVLDLPRPGPFRRDDAETKSRPTEVLPTEIINTLESTVRPTITDINLVLASTTAPTTTSSTAAIQTSTHATTSAAQPTATADSGTETSGGELSTIAKAGIAIGILGGVLAIFVLLYCMFSSRRKKLARQRQQVDDDEKINGPFADSAAIRSTPNVAPRLSLRPVTQFLPTFTTQGQAERRASRGIALTLNPVSAPSTTSLSPLNRPAGASAWERPTWNSMRNTPSPNGERTESSTGLHLHNPFNDTQRLHDEPVSPISSMGSFDHRFENRVGVATTSDPIPEPVSPIGGDDDDIGLTPTGGAGLSAASNLTRKTSIRKDLPKPLDLTKPPSPLYAVPPSPSGTEYSMHSKAPGPRPAPSVSAAEIAAAGGPSSSTVHRVQLDFKPTMQDELGLRAGQLVRLLHEYDDGWALCIRLDRSQQGVVPRTCLSTRPVKPRPPLAAAGSNPRGGPPVNPSYHHQQQYSNGGRPHSPGGFPSVPYGSGAGRDRDVSPGGNYYPPSPSQGQGQGQGMGGRPVSPNLNGNGRGGAYQQGYDQGAGNSPLGPPPGQAY